VRRQRILGQTSNMFGSYSAGVQWEGLLKNQELGKVIKSTRRPALFSSERNRPEEKKNQRKTKKKNSKKIHKRTEREREGRVCLMEKQRRRPKSHGNKEGESSKNSTAQVFKKQGGLLGR